MQTRVVIIGGGFGGLRAALALRKADVQVTLIDRRNYHLFQPLLYQVATGGLSPANIAAPLRSLVKDQANVRVLLGEVIELDVDGRLVVLRDSEKVPYDQLIVAAGATHSYFGHPEWERLAPGIKSIEDATAIRARILSAFESAERARSPAEASRWLTFVVVGAGPTGVELAGALAELAHETLCREFRAIDPSQARVLLVEAGDRVLASFSQELSIKALAALRRKSVEVRLRTKVTEIQPSAVTLHADGRVEQVEAETILWSAGVQASPLARILAEATGSQLDHSGRIQVLPDLSLPGHSEIVVIGDMAHCPGETGQPLPGLAPVAMQQGDYVAARIGARLARETWPAFRYRDQGIMATVGRMQAVCDIFGWKFAGPLAWCTWLLVHLMQIVQFENRLLVLVQW
ncbi:MAG: NAD(P)/FAD-dependent oxidoreductase, partial [Planctomycetes bacterium]|nr:NAD(P)/FAD-dependent oxidoreductase [Planctomycetota bacterium]